MTSENTEKRVYTRQIIKCPSCGYEYIPSEIIYPDSLMGKVNSGSIIRDPLGHILYEEYKEGYEPQVEENYICDNCGKSFVVELFTNFKVKKPEAEVDFTEDTSSLW